jgi:hypothetical protein
MLFSGAKPTHALMMFSSMALCFARAFTTGVPGGTCSEIIFCCRSIHLLYLSVT